MYAYSFVCHCLDISVPRPWQQMRTESEREKETARKRTPFPFSIKIFTLCKRWRFAVTKNHMIMSFDSYSSFSLYGSRICSFHEISWTRRKIDFVFYYFARLCRMVVDINFWSEWRIIIVVIIGHSAPYSNKYQQTDRRTNWCIPSNESDIWS